MMGNVNTFTSDNSCLPFDACRSVKSKKPAKYVITPDMHERIKRAYQNRVQCSGEIRNLAKRLGLPRWKVSRYAVRKGWIEKQQKEPDWSESEIWILKNNAQHCPEVIQRKLKQHGFHRTVNGIVLKRKRMRLPSNLGGMSATQLAECLGEDIHFVTRAIKQGRLKAKKRQDNRTEQQGGSMWFIKDKDIKVYIVENVHELDFKKIDKWWFVSILIGEDV